jgi:hypothetical protein
MGPFELGRCGVLRLDYLSRSGACLRGRALTLAGSIMRLQNMLDA